MPAALREDLWLSACPYMAYAGEILVFQSKDGIAGDEQIWPAVRDTPPKEVQVHGTAGTQI